MKTKDLLTIASTAVLTATLTVAFHASPLVSGNDANRLSPTIAKPKLVANGIEMTLSAANAQMFKAGDQPVFELRAVNTRNQPSDVAVCATLSASAPVSPISRAMPIATPLWRQEMALKLGPNETKVLTLSAQTNLPAKSNITVSLWQVDQVGEATDADNHGSQFGGRLGPGGKPGIVAMWFSTIPTVAAPASADGAALVPMVLTDRR